MIISVGYFSYSIVAFYVGFYYRFNDFSFFYPSKMLFYVSIDANPGILLLFGEVKYYFDALKNLSFPVLPMK